LTGGALVGSDSLSGSLSRDSGESVGSYSITQGTLAASANYNLTFLPGIFGILEAGEAPWVLQSGFDDLTLGNLDGQGGWTGNDKSTIEVVADPAEGTNQVFRFGPQSNDSIAKNLSTPIQTGEVATLFFRVYVPAGGGRINQQTRFLDPGDSYPIRLKWDNDPSEPVLWTFDAGMGGSSKQQVDQSIARDTWYDLWVVIDNANGLYRIYLEGGDHTTQTLVTSANLVADSDAHPFTPGLIDKLLFTGWDVAPVLYDDFYLAHGGENLSNPVEVIPPGESFAAWIEGYPGLSEADKDPLADPAGDGMPNLLKYAFGLDPLDASAGSKQGTLSEPGIPVLHHTVESTTGIALRYRRDTALSDISFQPEWSDSLGADANWRQDLMSEVVLSTENGVEWIEVRSSVVPAPEKQFLRIVIEVSN
jgi:hypothetical protein